MRRTILLALATLAAVAPAAAPAAVRITELMYQGVDGGDREFFELTNIGNSAVSVSGWTSNDSNPDAPVAFGDFFGSLAANESVILTQMTAAQFSSYWGLASTVRIFSFGDNSNLGSGDTINIYNSATQSAATLVDSVAYSGTTRGISRNRPVGVDGAVLNAQFANSAVGDIYGSVFAPTTPADLGNPGRFPVVTAAVPEPAAWAMMIAGFGLVGGTLRRRTLVLA